MIQSTTYLDSIGNQELIPQFTLTKFENTEDEWNVREMFQILKRALNQFFGAMDHNMVIKNKLSNVNYKIYPIHFIQHY